MTEQEQTFEAHCGACGSPMESGTCIGCGLTIWPVRPCCRDSSSACPCQEKKIREAERTRILKAGWDHVAAMYKDTKEGADMAAGLALFLHDLKEGRFDAQ